jgi:two-component system alkaline phosphatase synthesis response regulator PhoP
LKAPDYKNREPIAMPTFTTSRILLVEDEEDLSACIVDWLSKDRYIVDTAHDGLDALHKISTTAYDLIILDFLLPFVDGIEICRRARAQGLTIPILILTACNSSSVKSAALKSGADRYMTKPFKLKDLSSNLSHLLEQRICLPYETLLTASV